jgi:hypothetical protein
MKLTHRQKVKLARKMPRTAYDNRPPAHGIFNTEAWQARRKGRAARVKKQHDAASARAVSYKAKAAQLSYAAHP